MQWRPVTIFLMGLLIIFSETLTSLLFDRRLPASWVQIICAATALVLAWQEFRSRPPGSRWRFVVLLIGMVLVLILAALLILFVAMNDQ